MITRKGQSIYFSEHDVRPMGRSAAGVRGIRLKDADEVIAMDVISDEKVDVFTILENGFGKRTRIDHFTLQKRGGIGIRASKTSTKTGKVVEALVVGGDEGDVIIVSANGQMIRLPLKAVKRLGRDTQGVTLMRLKAKDKVSSMTIIKKDEIEETTSSDTEKTPDQTSSDEVPNVKKNFKNLSK